MVLAVLAGIAAAAAAAVPMPPPSRLSYAATALASVGLQVPHIAHARRSKKRETAKPVAPSGPQSEMARTLLKQGKKAQQMGDGAGAMSYFDKTVQVAVAAGDGASAARAHGAAGRMLLSVGQGEQAVERFGQAVAADPTYSAGYLNLAHAHLTNGDHRRGQSAGSKRIRATHAFGSPT